MSLNKLTPAPGSGTKNSKRRGRGPASGQGTTAGRGNKGQKARTGAKHHPWFEGGQMPLQRRTPKRGFSNKRFRQEYQIINVRDLNLLEDVSAVNADKLFEFGLIKKLNKPVKVLGYGEMTRAMEVTVDAFSDTAKEKIEKAGGKALVL
ncbi:MAG: 50S ribosomal protein L15 [Candidatus Marinimicrobia bacterium]|jgi:large subunit ribosomal protein L15|nr:50S ribosomal protein L15 [Candidatus Neomarinimicrobiota bacterium]MDD4960675.1 50S ribosomal protein L15 [Candidatus Neomarinimicrobiota bacterium]MDD5709206.1 50S ribosomal protein L15 [Candidatus Neomarinimicrobiota bacterium]MDX9777925.1 50S ribosomal protein L15 [bacterium]